MWVGTPCFNCVQHRRDLVPSSRHQGAMCVKQDLFDLSMLGTMLAIKGSTWEVSQGVRQKSASARVALLQPLSPAPLRGLVSKK